MSQCLCSFISLYFMRRTLEVLSTCGSSLNFFYCYLILEAITSLSFNKISHSNICPLCQYFHRCPNPLGGRVVCFHLRKRPSPTPYVLLLQEGRVAYIVGGVMVVHTTEILIVRFQVLTAASMNMTLFWDVTPFSLVVSDRRFRGTFCLYHHGDDRPYDGGS
jgi:hypothetical protein